jgi:hypothetical protein
MEEDDDGDNDEDYGDEDSYESDAFSSGAPEQNGEDDDEDDNFPERMRRMRGRRDGRRDVLFINDVEMFILARISCLFLGWRGTGTLAKRGVVLSRKELGCLCVRCP